MAIQSERLRVSGVRCERCVGRLAAALRGQEGLVEASANLMGQVSLAWDDGLTSRQTLVDALARAGFRELDTVAATPE